MSSSCSHPSPVKRVSSERRNSISDLPPAMRSVPTKPASLGRPNISPLISPLGSWASTKPGHFFLCLPSLARSSNFNQSERRLGCIVSLMTSMRSALNVSRSVSVRSFEEKASRVFLASYFLR